MLLGLIASWASCISFFLLEKVLFAVYFSPKFSFIYSLAALLASSEILTESVLIYVTRPSVPLPFLW